ncbi:hypothetical protein ACFL0Z_02350 [Patescibacteria group bacterium]
MTKLLHLPPDGQTKIRRWEIVNRVIYEWLLTPDHLTAFRPIITVMMLRLAYLGTLEPWQFPAGIILCVLSDIFDGPLARVLRGKYGIEPRPFFLARWIPLFQGGHFDTLSDKFALGTGIYLAIYFGYPWLPLLGMISFTAVKVISSCHGAWLLGFSYWDFGKILIGLASEDFGERLKEYGIKTNQSLLEGQIATICQASVLGLAALWTIVNWPYFIAIGYAVSLAAIICDFIAYRAYLRRYLEENGGQLFSHPDHFLTQMKTELPFTEENRGLIALPVSHLLILLGGYYLVNQISPEK